MTPAQLKAIRNGLKWSLGDMGARTGYSKQHIHQVEAGKYAVTDELVNRLTKAVKKSFETHEKIMQKLENKA